jgi:peptide/nickel transport system permease protein
MLKYIIRRFLISIPTLIGAFIIIFLLTRFVPGDPVLVILEEHYTQDSYEAVQAQLGLDQPVWRQMVNSFVNLAQGDLGRSFHNNRPVLTNIGNQIMPTIYLSIAALLVAALIGIPAGLVSARNYNRWPDITSMIGSMIALCAPNFWLGILLMLVFSLYLGIFPVFGTGEAGDPISMLMHLVLPAMTLGAAGAGLVARVTRSAMLEVLDQDYIRTARAKGLAERVVVYKHGLRNASLPVATIFGLEAVTLITGTVVVESVFARRGIGRLLVDSVLTRDYPQIQAILLLFVIMAIVINLVVDILYAYLDPRIRYD